MPLHWKHGILTTGLPWKSLTFFFNRKETKTQECEKKEIEKNTIDLFAGVFLFSLKKLSQTEGKNTFCLLKKIEHDTATGQKSQIILKRSRMLAEKEGKTCLINTFVKKEMYLYTPKIFERF